MPNEGCQHIGKLLTCRHERVKISFTCNFEKQLQTKSKKKYVVKMSTYFWPYNSPISSVIIYSTSLSQCKMISVVIKYFIGRIFSLTSSCSRCVQKLWWGWVGWGWRQILPPHQHNAKLWGEKEKKMNHHLLIYFMEVREGEANRYTERNTPQSINQIWSQACCTVRLIVPKQSLIKCQRFTVQ